LYRKFTVLIAINLKIENKIMCAVLIQPVCGNATKKVVPGLEVGCSCFVGGNYEEKKERLAEKGSEP